MLLLSTLFRLGLNVASTRLILSDADAGEVISAFGTLLIKGEVLVGVIIFLIITAVNFVVVARGSTRVSEVAARFTLDALPGKQMAIDSELKSGLISAREAHTRREQLRKESQLFGSMDGAMKFVQGDALVGLFITATNILGGLYIGLSKGFSFGEAIDVYTLLTVGDGLVTQIPSLLVSICAGIVVTRVAAEEGSTLGSDVRAQLFDRPALLFFAAFLLLFFAFIPGLPAFPFVLVGLTFLIWASLSSGALVAPAKYLRSTGLQLASTQSSSDLRLPEPNRKNYVDSPILLELDSFVLFHAYESQSSRYSSVWKEFQAMFRSNSGLQFPDFSVKPSNELPPGGYKLSVHNIKVESGELPLDSDFISIPKSFAELFGFDVVKTDISPLFRTEGSWVKRSIAQKDLASSSRIPLLSPFRFLLIRAASYLKQHPEELLRATEVFEQLQSIEKSSPGFVAATIDTEFFTPARLTEVCQQLVREGLNISDFRRLVESLGRFMSSYGRELIREDAYDLEEIVVFLRSERKRELIERCTNNRGAVRVIEVSREVEEIIEASPINDRSLELSLSEEHFERLKRELEVVKGGVSKQGVAPISFLIDSSLVFRLSLFLKGLGEISPVLGRGELVNQVEYESLAVWRG